MRVAVVLVHYHAADLLAEAHEALMRDFESTDLVGEWVVIDNGSRPEERERLRALPVRVIDPGGNSGYAGGANLGVRETEADFIVLMNPDVLVQPGCIRGLCEALGQGAAAAGPRFFWDREQRFLLPPTERQTRRDEVLRLLGERGRRWARLGRRRWRRHARRCWTARESYCCYELSGALLAFRRQVWNEVGGFDEGYRLYFEETDWLERLRARGLDARFVPQAQAVHLYAQSTVGEPRSAGWFVESHRRFRRRFHGAAFTALLESAHRAWHPTALCPAEANAETWRSDFGEMRPPEAQDGALWLEVSASALGYPAAARALEGPAPGLQVLAEEARGQLPPGTYTLRLVDRVGRELDALRVDVSCPLEEVP